jgi:diguanylate cyclase (GGDEF)-like protein/putative nucleotidyltransferase with HDIG domain
MRQFSLAAKIFIWSVVVVSPVAFVVAWLLPTDWSRWPLIAVGCLLAAFASASRVTLFSVPRRGEGVENSATMSLGFLPTFLLVLSMGPFAGMLAGAVNMIVTTCFTKNPSRYFQVLFSVSAVSLSAFVSGMLLRPFGLANGDWKMFELLASQDLNALLPILGVFLATAAYYLVNTGLVAMAIALTTQRSIWPLWRDHFLWTGPGYFAGASCAMLAFALIPFVPEYPIAALAFGTVAIPIPTIIFFGLKFHRERDVQRTRNIEELQQSKAELEKSNAELERSREELQQLYTSTVESLALAIDAKDRYTKEHIQRVRGIAVSIARELGLTGNDLKAVETGALLHDIGKLAVPEQILTKPGRLTEEEFEKMKTHPDMGARILQPVQFPFPVLSVVRSHHERWDGSGYPDGLAGEDIPLGGRILAVADVYDALTTDRSYRRGWPHEQAVAYLEEQSGKQFDPRMVDAFLRVLAHSPRLQVMSGFGGASLPSLNSFSPERQAVTQDINRASFEYISLYEVAQAVSTTLNLNETLTLLTGKVRNLFSASTCVVSLLDSEGMLVVQRVIGANERRFRGKKIARGHGFTGGVAATKVGVVRGDFDPADLGVSTTGDPVWLPLQSTLIAPLVAGDTCIGTIALYHERHNAFDTEHLRVLTAVAVQAGRGIQNAREFDETRQSALRDSLTGLYNARHLGQFLDGELKSAVDKNTPLTVLVLDLDNFKPVNDRFGHARGNQVLRDLGAIFHSVLRSGDLVARYAGDEFVIVLPGTGAAEARTVVEKMRAAVAEYDPRLTGEHLGDITVGVSIGAATFPQDGMDTTTLMAFADRAMYRDKNARKAEKLAAERLHLVA